MYHAPHLTSPLQSTLVVLANRPQCQPEYQFFYNESRHIKLNLSISKYTQLPALLHSWLENSLVPGPGYEAS